MTTEFIHTDEINDEVLARAGEIIRRGGLVVFPTETVYGLGANALDAEAAKKVYAAKGRPSDNPLITHIATPEDADKYAVTNETYRRLARAFMPGPLTVILPKRDCIPLTTTGGLDSVGIRCPENKIARRLIAAAGVPIAAPSANLSGKPSPTRAEHVRYDLDGKVDMILDGGDCTVVDLPKIGQAMTGSRIRFKAVSVEEAEKLLAAEEEYLAGIEQDIQNAHVRSYTLSFNGTQYEVAVHKVSNRRRPQ